MMKGVFRLRDYDVLCRSALGTELPFSRYRKHSGADFLFGGNRPEVVIPETVLYVSKAA